MSHDMWQMQSYIKMGAMALGFFWNDPFNTEIYDIQLFYDVLNILWISLSLAHQIEKLNRPHHALRP